MEFSFWSGEDGSVVFEAPAAREAVSTREVGVQGDNIHGIISC